MSTESFVVVSYDVANDRRRTRVSNQLENFGTRVQFSVFECHLSDEQFRALRRRLARHIHPKEDQIRYYMLCRKDRARARVDGSGEVTDDPDYFIS